MRLLLLSALLSLVCATSHAVVITSGDGSGNTTPPPDDPGFANVATKGDSAVYLGGGWVVTANHSGVGAVYFDGVRYEAIPESAVQIQHDETQGTDILLFQIENPPPLPALMLPTAPIGVGEPVVMIGNGNNRAVASTEWDEDWAEVTPPGLWQGWKQSSGRTIRWGGNVVTVVDSEVEAVGSTTWEFAMDFDPLLHEAQGVSGDSGGAVFAKRGGSWELVGVLNFVSLWPGQPGATEVFGNRTYAADLYRYRVKIAQVVSPVVPSMSFASWAVAVAAMALVGVLSNRSSVS